MPSDQKIKRGDLRMGLQALRNGWPVSDAKLRELHSGAIELSLTGSERERITASEFLAVLAKSGRTTVIAAQSEQTKKTATPTRGHVATSGSRAGDPSILVDA